MTTDIPKLEPGQETLLDLKIDELKRELATQEAPAAIEAVLARRFRASRAGERRPRLWWMPPLALAATVALVSWIARTPLHAPAAPAQGEIADSDAGPFLALRPLDRIALEPGTTVVRRTEFPRAMLADWGLPVSPERAAEPVRAEMLYSLDGEPLAVRFLN
jgi:hypothetical protein